MINLSWGFVGLWQNLILLPVLFVLDAEGWETFELPPRRILGLYFLTLGIDVVSQVTNRLSVVYGGPFIFSLCLLFTSPLGFAVDALFRGTHFSYFSHIIMNVCFYEIFGYYGYFSTATGFYSNQTSRGKERNRGNKHWISSYTSVILFCNIM